MSIKFQPGQEEIFDCGTQEIKPTKEIPEEKPIMSLSIFSPNGTNHWVMADDIYPYSHSVEIFKDKKLVAIVPRDHLILISYQTPNL